ncbi:basic proline-rich protein-like [Mustela nigripes]|uniref:basic proline-rich protein-like n=1 Tax=Mustela nigripes TaxID=77151 RepID=UPI0028169D50|nr:basic proline-rich protein-like [Mustela nigripes]
MAAPREGSEGAPRPRSGAPPGRPRLRWECATRSRAASSSTPGVDSTGQRRGSLPRRSISNNRRNQACGGVCRPQQPGAGAGEREDETRAAAGSNPAPRPRPTPADAPRAGGGSGPRPSALPAPTPPPLAGPSPAATHQGALLGSRPSPALPAGSTARRPPLCREPPPCARPRRSLPHTGPAGHGPRGPPPRSRASPRPGANPTWGRRAPSRQGKEQPRDRLPNSTRTASATGPVARPRLRERAGPGSHLSRRSPRPPGLALHSLSAARRATVSADPAPKSAPPLAPPFSRPNFDRASHPDPAPSALRPAFALAPPPPSTFSVPRLRRAGQISI